MGSSLKNQGSFLKKEKRFPNNNVLNPKGFYLSSKAADVHFVFEVKGQEILVPAHKIMLAARSSVFHSMFFGDSKEIDTVKISDASINAFKEFLALFYLDEVDIYSQHVYEFTNLAKKYNVSQGMEMGEHFLIEISNTHEMCSHLGFAMENNLKELQKFCKEGIKANARELFKSHDFINTTADVLRTILQLDDYNCFETEIFDACMSWAENACKRYGIDTTDRHNLRRILEDSFYLIPITAMNIEDFSKVLSSNTSMFSNKEISDIITYIATGTSSEFTYKFACSANEARAFEWNKDMLSFENDLTWQSCGGTFVQECTTFSSSHKLLFGAFRMFGMKICDSDSPLSLIISILQRGDTFLPNWLHEKIRFIYKSSNASDTILFKLEKPIIINPHMKYTILVDFSDNEQLIEDNGRISKQLESGSACYKDLRVCSTQGNEDVYIKYHKDPEIEDSQGGTLISALYFNRL